MESSQGVYFLHCGGIQSSQEGRNGFPYVFNNAANDEDSKRPTLESCVPFVVEFVVSGFSCSTDEFVDPLRSPPTGLEGGAMISPPAM